MVKYVLTTKNRYFCWKISLLHKTKSSILNNVILIINWEWAAVRQQKPYLGYFSFILISFIVKNLISLYNMHKLSGSSNNFKNLAEFRQFIDTDRLGGQVKMVPCM